MRCNARMHAVVGANKNSQEPKAHTFRAQKAATHTKQCPMRVRLYFWFCNSSHTMCSAFFLFRSLLGSHAFVLSARKATSSFCNLACACLLACWPIAGAACRRHLRCSKRATSARRQSARFALVVVFI